MSENGNRAPYIANALSDQERIALSFRASGAGLWGLDIDSGGLYCDSRWCEILGIDPSISPIASVEAFKSHIHPDDVVTATLVDRSGVEALLERNESYRMEFRIIRPDKSIRWVRSTACIVRDPSTKHLRAIGCITDITEFRSIDRPDGHEKATVETLGEGRLSHRASKLEPVPVTPRLTVKEQECLLWVSAGKTAWETATILGGSRRTVEFHLRNAVRKLDAGNKVHAAFIAIRRNLLTDVTDARSTNE